MSVRREGQQERVRRVREAAWRLFLQRGYAATSVRDIAAEAAVSTGTVRNVGDKAALFLQVMEEAATSQAREAWNAISARRPTRKRPLAEEVWSFFAPTLDAADANTQLFKDYWAAYVARADSRENEARVADVVDAIARRWCDHAGLEPPQYEANLAAFTMYSAYTVTLLAISTGLDSGQYRGYLRAVVDQQCAISR